MWFRATSNVSKILGGSERPSQNFLNFAKSCILLCWLQFDNKKRGSPSSFLSYKRFKLKLRVILSRSYCCYGNLLCHKVNSILFPEDWAICWYHDFGVNKYRVVIMTHQTLSLEKYWKLFSATLRRLASVKQLCCLKLIESFFDGVGGGVGMLFVVSFRIIKKWTKKDPNCCKDTVK